MGSAEVVWLLVAGLAMGSINNLAGAAGVLGLMALEDACGLAPDIANGSLRLAAVAIGTSGWFGFHSRGLRVPRRSYGLALYALPGALLGATLALHLPVWAYRSYLLAVMVAVMAQQLRNAHPGDGARRHGGTTAALGVLLVGAHMGFVQVGTGLVAILALTATYSANLVEVNAAKMVIVIVSSIASLVLFAVNDAVAWPQAAVLAAGAAVGSFLASRWSVRRGHGAVRAVVLAITTAVILRLLWQLTR